MACLALLLGNCQATPLRVALGEGKAPYIYPETQRGVEVELVTAILQESGYQAQLVFVPNKRAHMLLDIGEVDAAIGSNSGYPSEPYIAYQNVAVTLCSAHIVLNSIADLAGRRIGAFQNAHLFLGPEFAAISAGSPDYREPVQSSINRMLFARRIDVAISDINIFKSINGQLGLGTQVSERWCPHALFSPTTYRLAFRDRVARDRFDAALKRALRGNLYETIARRHQLSFIHGRPYFKPTPTISRRE